MKLSYFIPPIYYLIKESILSFLHPNLESQRLEKKLKSSVLFDGHDSLFKKQILECENYVEIGCGQSTVYCCTLKHLNKIVAIDTSSTWLKYVEHLVPNDSKVTLHHTNFGKVGEWGRPLNYTHIDQLHDYTSAVFKYCNPDLILIDGRFRVFCFLFTLQEATIGTRIIFDDYTNRPHYHIIETVVRPIETCGRQALFMKTQDFDVTLIETLMSSFEYVMD
jgi:hypothetical protein